MDTKIVIALYHPHTGQEDKLKSLLKQHVPTLRKLELVTDRDAIVVKTQNNTFMEIFEWRSEKASVLAHEHPEVTKMWEQIGQVADFAKLDTLEEAKAEFPHFEVIAL